MKSGPSNLLSLQYLKNQDIDKAKWDKCIHTASNGLIYGYSFYLDAMSKHWDALVMNDYEAVMPLTWNKKFGIYYLYQPFLCASLGVFGKNVTSEMLLSFLDAIPRQFKYWDIYLNRLNNFNIEGYNLYKRTNYILALNKTYPALFNNFRSSYKQLIKKAEVKGLAVKKNIAIEKIIKLAKNKLEKVSKLKKNDFQNFQDLYKKLYAENKAASFGVFLKEELLASGAFLFSHNRAYYILAGNKPKGRPFGASQLVINAFIEQYAGKDLILDFEGSNIPQIAFFFKGFGALPEEYPGLKYNALPPILRKLKS
jgi:lipid II:glycine glycyltransferase (peptidoglycan interpeptide bridge formation enzyme)